MKVSIAGVTLIKEFEGFPHGGRPYKDLVGVWTIGYGHTEGVGPNSALLSEPQASELLRKDLDRRYAPPVVDLGVGFNQHQFDAIVSFVYNCGPGAISTSTRVGRALRAEDWPTAADALLAWDKAGGVAIAGLTRRRRAERAMFLTAGDALTADDPLEGYTESEQRWIREYDRLLRRAEGPRAPPGAQARDGRAAQEDLAQRTAEVRRRGRQRLGAPPPPRPLRVAARANAVAPSMIDTTSTPRRRGHHE